MQRYKITAPCRQGRACQQHTSNMLASRSTFALGKPTTGSAATSNANCAQSSVVMLSTTGRQISPTQSAVERLTHSPVGDAAAASRWRTQVQTAQRGDHVAARPKRRTARLVRCCDGVSSEAREDLCHGGHESTRRQVDCKQLHYDASLHSCQLCRCCKRRQSSLLGMATVMSYCRHHNFAGVCGNASWRIASALDSTPQKERRTASMRKRKRRAAVGMLQDCSLATR
jgi:hypothetical protein